MNKINYYLLYLQIWCIFMWIMLLIDLVRKKRNERMG